MKISTAGRGALRYTQPDAAERRGLIRVDETRAPIDFTAVVSPTDRRPYGVVKAELAAANAGRAANEPQMTVTVTFPVRVAPALRAAVEEISNEVGGRLEGAYPYVAEQAFTDGVTALGFLRAALAAAIPVSDRNWVKRGR